MLVVATIKLSVKQPEIVLSFVMFSFPHLGCVNLLIYSVFSRKNMKLAVGSFSTLILLAW